MMFGFLRLFVLAVLVFHSMAVFAKDAFYGRHIATCHMAGSGGQPGKKTEIFLKRRASDAPPKREEAWTGGIAYEELDGGHPFVMLQVNIEATKSKDTLTITSLSMFGEPSSKFVLQNHTDTKVEARYPKSGRIMYDLDCKSDW